MSATTRFTAVISYDPGEHVYNVDVPSLPGCHTWGRTKREAFRHAREAIAAYVEAMEAAGQPLPPPGAVSVLEVSA